MAHTLPEHLRIVPYENPDSDNPFATPKFQVAGRAILGQAVYVPFTLDYDMADHIRDPKWDGSYELNGPRTSRPDEDPADQQIGFISFRADQWRYDDDAGVVSGSPNIYLGELVSDRKLQFYLSNSFPETKNDRCVANAMAFDMRRREHDQLGRILGVYFQIAKEHDQDPQLAKDIAFQAIRESGGQILKPRFMNLHRLQYSDSVQFFERITKSFKGMSLPKTMLDDFKTNLGHALQNHYPNPISVRFHSRGSSGAADNHNVITKYGGKNLFAQDPALNTLEHSLQMAEVSMRMGLQRKAREEAEKIEAARKKMVPVPPVPLPPIPSAGSNPFSKVQPPTVTQEVGAAPLYDFDMIDLDDDGKPVMPDLIATDEEVDLDKIQRDLWDQIDQQ